MQYGDERGGDSGVRCRPAGRSRRGVLSRSRVCRMVGWCVRCSPPSAARCPSFGREPVARSWVVKRPRNRKLIVSRCRRTARRAWEADLQVGTQLVGRRHSVSDQVPSGSDGRAQRGGRLVSTTRGRSRGGPCALRRPGRRRRTGRPCSRPIRTATRRFFSWPGGITYTVSPAWRRASTTGPSQRSIPTSVRLRPAACGYSRQACRVVGDREPVRSASPRPRRRRDRPWPSPLQR